MTNLEKLKEAGCVFLEETSQVFISNEASCELSDELGDELNKLSFWQYCRQDDGWEICHGTLHPAGGVLAESWINCDGEVVCKQCQMHWGIKPQDACYWNTSGEMLSPGAFEEAPCDIYNRMLNRFEYSNLYAAEWLNAYACPEGWIVGMFDGIWGVWMAPGQQLSHWEEP